MHARLALLCLALAPASWAASGPRDKPAASDDLKSRDLITEYGTNADLPPDRWACANRSASGRDNAEGKDRMTPLERASDLKCLTEWLWSVQRYFAAGGKPKKGLEPEFIAAEKKRAAGLADWLSKWAQSSR